MFTTYSSPSDWRLKLKQVTVGHATSAVAPSALARTLLLQFRTSCTNTVSPRMPPRKGAMTRARPNLKMTCD